MMIVPRFTRRQFVFATGASTLLRRQVAASPFREIT